MDHTNAVLMELKDDTIVEKVIVSELTPEEKELSLKKSEKFLNKKKQYFQSKYYCKLLDIMRSFNEIVVFGPTDAKNELLNLLKLDHLYENIKILVIPADKMGKNQMHKYVRGIFDPLTNID